MQRSLQLVILTIPKIHQLVIQIKRNRKVLKVGKLNNISDIKR